MESKAILFETLHQFLSLSKNVNSSYCKITCDVPLVSILGSTLFLIYINELFRGSTKLTSIMLIDDTNLYISVFNIDNLFKTIKEEINKVLI